MCTRNRSQLNNVTDSDASRRLYPERRDKQKRAFFSVVFALLTLKKRREATYDVITRMGFHELSTVILSSAL